MKNPIKMISKSDFDKELDKAAGKHVGQPETLEMCLKKFMEKAPETEIGIKRYGNKGLMNAGTFTVRELADMPEIDSFIRDQYGGGRFILEFFDGDKRTLARYSRNIDGTMKQYGTKAEGNGDAAKSGGKSFQQDIIAIFQAQLKAAQEQNTVLMGMAISGRDSSTSDEFMMKLASNAVDNNLTREEYGISRLREIIALENEIRPNIPPEDGTAAMASAAITALPSIIQVLMSRNANSPPSALMDGRGAANMKSLPPGLAALSGATPEQIKSVLQSPTPEQLEQLGKSLAPITPAETVELPGPGAQQPVQTEPHGVQSVPPPQIPPEHITFEVKIQQLRTDAKNGVEPGILADEIYALVEAARLLTPDNPHPLLKELTQEDDLATLLVAMMTFFRRIPEFADPELQEKIGHALYAIKTGEIIEDQAQEAGENSELLSTAPGVQPGQDDASDTSDAAESNATEQTERGEIDAPEPGGNDSERLDQPGPVPDRADAQAQVA